MLLARGRTWRAELAKDESGVVLTLGRELPEEVDELRELRFDVPLARWNAVVKHVQSDRKLLGGLLLDFANQKELVAMAIARDRLWLELARVVLDATAVLVGAGRLFLAPADGDES